MKKLLILLAAGAIAFSFTACGNGKATSQEAVDQLADPWVDMAELEEAETAAGFTVELPAAVALADDAAVRYCEALNEIEVQFSDPYGYLRKAKDDGDISGDYEAYPEEKTIEVNGCTATLKGPEKGYYNLAVWKNGDFSYCIGFDAPADEETMKEYVEELK